MKRYKESWRDFIAQGSFWFLVWFFGEIFKEEIVSKNGDFKAFSKNFLRDRFFFFFYVREWIIFEK